MSGRRLVAMPLDAERFAPYGHVIVADPERRQPMNGARFDRYDALAPVETAAGRPASISIVRARHATPLPQRVELVERHPLASQAFVPLGAFRFVVLVGPAGATVEADDLEAFVTNGRQGVSYRPGVWHMPLFALEAGQAFLAVDCQADGNCEEHVLADPVTLVLDR